MKCVEVYKELYHQEPYGVAFCPYRISPLGAHIDHQYGKIKAAEEAKKAEAESVLKKLLAEGMSADEILEKLK